MNKVTRGVLGGLQDLGLEQANAEKPYELDYGNNLVCFFDFAEPVQRALKRFTKVVTLFDMRLAPPTCEAL